MPKPPAPTHPDQGAQQRAAAHYAQGLQALQGGAATQARSAFESALNLRSDEPASWFGLALACARIGDEEAALTAINRVLALDPHNLRALLFKGDHHTRSGATRKALAAYQGALRLAQRSPEQPADVRQGLDRAEQHSRRFAADYQRYLLAELNKVGHQPGTSRFDEALAIAFGQSEPHLQQPTRFYFPGLAPIPFFDPAAFPELEAAVDATAAMVSELQPLLIEPERFAPYIASNPDSVPLNDTALLNHDDWSAYYFYEAGNKVAANAAACPATFAVLEELPLPHIPGSTPHALFSKLAPKTHIPPHVGLINTRLICHVPLIVPPDCGGLRCGNAHQDWQPGTAIVFDDSIEHEAWNNSDAERVVLIFDLWRPELSEEERALVTHTLSAVARYEQEADRTP